jgi:hypothetical protein
MGAVCFPGPNKSKIIHIYIYIYIRTPHASREPYLSQTSHDRVGLGEVWLAIPFPNFPRSRGIGRGMAMSSSVRFSRPFVSRARSLSPPRSCQVVEGESKTPGRARAGVRYSSSIRLGSLLPHTVGLVIAPYIKILGIMMSNPVPVPLRARLVGV